MPTARACFALAAQDDLEIDHDDISQAFVQSDEFPSDVKLFLTPPEFAEADPDVVWRLRKPLYGLAIAPKAWSDTFKRFVITTEGWQPVAFEDCLYTRTTASGRKMLLLVYVDDILTFWHPDDHRERAAWKSALHARFDTRSEGSVTNFLGIQVTRDRDKHTITISQSEYIQDLLDRHNLPREAHSTDTPLSPGVHLTREDSPTIPLKELGTQYREIVGSLQWLATCTRPDLAHAAQALASFSSNPGPEHMKEAKRTLRYLNGTIDLGITYTRSATPLANTLFGFCDSDWAACLDTRRSIGAYILLLNGGAIAWRSKNCQEATISGPVHRRS